MTIKNMNSYRLFMPDKINILKIIIIGFIGFYLITNFIPYYDTSDGYTLASIGIKLSQGEYAITNELLEKTGRFEFKPGDWANTIDPSKAIPLGPIGFHFWAAFVYLTTGNFGLFYFGPISGIILLIVSDRISTKLFGKKIGLLTILFLATNHIFLRSAVSFQTESTATIFFLLGFFLIIKFLKTQSNFTIFLASSFLTISTLIRIGNSIYFPTELIFLISYFIFVKYKRKCVEKTNNNKFNKKILSKSFFRKSGLIILPWIIFFIFWFGYHDAFFGDPFTTQIIIQRGAGTTDKELSSFLEIENRHFENVKQYSKYLLPYQFPAMESSIFSNLDHLVGKFWLGMVSLLILFSSIAISLKSKDHRKEIVAIAFFILSTVWFYAALTSEDRASFGVPGRYMFPAFTLFYMLLSFLIVKFYSIDTISAGFRKFLVKLLKIGIIISLGTFFVTSMYFTPYGQAIVENDYQIKNPFEFSVNHPPPMEGITKNSVIVALKTDTILEYDVIPFQIVPIDDKKAPADSISLLTDTINDDYSVYVFKAPTTIHEKIILQDLIDNHHFFLEDYSESFCTIKIKTNENLSIQSDPICLLN